jgi:hypothetical protein
MPMLALMAMLEMMKIGSQSHQNCSCCVSTVRPFSGIDI